MVQCSFITRRLLSLTTSRKVSRRGPQFLHRSRRNRSPRPSRHKGGIDCEQTNPPNATITANEPVARPECRVPPAATSSTTAAACFTTTEEVAVGTSTVASDSVKNQLWLQRWDIARCVRYYARESNIRSRWQTASQAALLLSSFSAVGTVVDLIDAPAIMDAILSGISVVGAVFVVANYTWNHSLKVASILSASEQCRSIETEAKTVWSELENKSDQQANADFSRLQKALDAATSQVERNGISYSEKRNTKAAEEARKVLEHESLLVPLQLSE